MVMCNGKCRVLHSKSWLWLYSAGSSVKSVIVVFVIFNVRLFSMIQD